MVTSERAAERGPMARPRAVRPTLIVRRRLAVAGAVLAVSVAVVLHLNAALSAGGPVWSDDEIGPLATSRLIAGVGDPLVLNHLSYYPGWPVVLAPLWWFMDDPGSVYHAAVLMSAAAACLTIAPLAAIAHRMSVSRPIAVMLAAMVMAGPARVVMSDYAITEAFFALVVVTTMWLGLRYTERETWLRAVLLAFAAAYTFFTHGRGLVLPIAVALFFLARARRRTWWISAIGIAMLAIATISFFVVHKSLSGALYPGEANREDAAVGTLLKSVTGPLLAALSGQTWYVLVAWLCLPAFGAVILASGLRREWSARMPGGAALVALVTLGALATGALATGDTLSVDSGRFDVIVYGRYVDPFLLPLVVVGLVAVARGMPRRRGAIAWVVTALLLAVFLWRVAPMADVGGLWFAMNIAGLLLWTWPLAATDPTPFRVASVAILALGALVVLAGRQLRWLSVALVGAILIFATWTAQTEVAQPWNRAAQVVPSSVATLAKLDDLLGDQVEVAYFTGDASYSGQNLTQYWLIPRTVHVVGNIDDVARSEVVIARRSWPEAESAGARRLIGLTPENDALWVLPGDLSDRLAALGYLEPPSGAALANPAYALRLASEAPGSESVAAGAAVIVQVVNLGSQTWPVPATSDDPVGAVRLVATWAQGGLARDTVVDLPRGVFPGGTIRVEVPLVVPADLVRGQATVTFRLVQESLPALGDPVNGLTTIDLRLR